MATEEANTNVDTPEVEEAPAPPEVEEVSTTRVVEESPAPNENHARVKKISGNDDDEPKTIWTKNNIVMFLVVVVGIALGVIISVVVKNANEEDNDKMIDEGGVTPPATSPFLLSIFHVNDHHSHLEDDDFDVVGADAGIALPEVSVRYGGFPRLVSLFNQVASESKNVLKLHAGDAITGTTYYTAFEGAADAAMMNLVCFDAFALGNHEFDDGDDSLAKFITELQRSDACPDTPVLSANLVPAATSPLQALVDEGKIAPSSVFRMGNGEEVGVVGINIRNKTLMSSSPSEGTDYLDEIETATAHVEALTAAGINKIVLLTHIGYSNDLSMMVEIPGVDVIVGGDSHSLLGNEAAVSPIGIPEGPYPMTVVFADDRKVCVVTAWEYAHGVGKLEVEFDDAGVVTSCNGQTMIPFDATTMSADGVAVSLVDAAAVQGYLEGLGSTFVAVTADAEAEAVLAVFAEQMEAQFNTTVATVPEGICYERVPGEGRSDICTGEETASQGGGACNLVAQAFLTQAFTADIAIQNGGGCRTDIEAGNFTFEDAYALLPFSNTLETLEMTGAEVVLVLEQALNNIALGGSSGSYPYASGLRYDVNNSAPFLERFSNIEVNPRLESDVWVPIDEVRLYTVVTNSFIAAGRDGYFAFGEVSDELVTDTFIEYAQALIDYAEAEEVLVDVPLELYSTQSYLP